MGNVVQMSKYRRRSVDIDIYVSDEIWYQLENIAAARGQTVSELMTERAVKLVDDTKQE